MKALRRRWAAINARYAALSRRERLLVTLLILLGPALVLKTLVADPQWVRLRALEKSLATQGATLNDMKTLVISQRSQLASDPDAAKKLELATLTADREALDRQVAEAGSRLVRPAQMNALLEHLLARHAGLRLVSLKTLAPVSIVKAGDAGKANGEKPEPRVFDLYRHGVEIRLEGSYGELQSYLEQLERMPQRLLWERVEFRVVEHPRAEMILNVFTLSPDRTWLAL